MSVTDKMKTWSLTHVVSIGALLIFGVVVNAIYFYFAAHAGVLQQVFTGNFMWLAFVDIAVTAALAYYSVSFTVGAQGIVAETARTGQAPPVNVQLTPELLQALQSAAEAKKGG